MRTNRSFFQSGELYSRNEHHNKLNIITLLSTGAALASPTTLEIKSDMLHIIKESTLKQEIFTGIHATLSQGDYHTVEG